MNNMYACLFTKILNELYRPHDVKYEEDTEPAAREKVVVPNDWQWSNTQYLMIFYYNDRIFSVIIRSLT